MAWLFAFGEPTPYSPGALGAMGVFVSILLTGILAFELRTRISELRSCGLKFLDLGPMPRRGERSAALALALGSVAMLAIGISRGRPIDPIAMVVLCSLVGDPLGKFPFCVFGRAGVHRLGVRGDFGISGLFLAWEAIQRAEIDREHPSLLLFSGGSVFRVPLSGVDPDLLERVIPKEKLEGVPSPPPSPEIALDRYAR